MKRRIQTLVIGGLVLCAVQLAWARKWSDVSGKFSVEAELVEVRADKVVLRKADGQESEIPIARLSEADRQYLESLSQAAPATAEPAADRQVGRLLQMVLQQSDVPAIAAAIVTSDGLVAFGVAGVRKRGTQSPATPSDLWHLGSDTKAMTATL